MPLSHGGVIGPAGSCALICARSGAAATHAAETRRATGIGIRSTTLLQRINHASIGSRRGAGRAAVLIWCVSGPVHVFAILETPRARGQGISGPVAASLQHPLPYKEGVWVY